MVSYMTVVFFDDFPVNHTGIQVQLPCSLLFSEAQEIPTTWSRPYFNNHPQISNYVVASCGRLPCSTCDTVPCKNQNRWTDQEQLQSPHSPTHFLFATCPGKTLASAPKWAPKVMQAPLPFQFWLRATIFFPLPPGPKARWSRTLLPAALWWTLAIREGSGSRLWHYWSRCRSYGCPGVRWPLEDRTG